MESAQSISRTSILYAICFGLLASAIVFAYTSPYTIALSPDSVYYYSASRSLILGKGFTHVDWKLTAWPPLYSLILSFIGLVDSSRVFQISRFLNIAVVFIINGATYFILEAQVGRKYATLGTLFVVLSAPLILVSTYLLTELFFTLFCLFLIIILNQYVKSTSAAWLFFSVFFASISSLTRYIGVVNIALLAIVVLWRNRHRLKYGLCIASVTLIASSIPLGLWLLRNYQVDGTLAGPRFSSSAPIWTHLSQTYTTMLAWFIPGRISDDVIVQILVTVIIIITLTLVLKLTKGRLFLELYENHLIFIFALFTCLYIGFLTVSSTIVVYDRIGNRLLAPVYIPIVFILFTLIEKLSVQPTIQKIVSRSTYVALLVVVASLVSKVYVNGVRQFSETTAGGYNSVKWRESETVKNIIELIQYSNALQTRDNVLRIYSNDPWGLDFYLLEYMLLGEVKIEIVEIPRKIPSQSVFDMAKEFTFQTPAYLVWFEVRAQGNFSIPELEQVLLLTNIGIYDDGEVYRINGILT